MRTPNLKPSSVNREADLERRVAALERLLLKTSAGTTDTKSAGSTKLISQTAHGLAVGNVVRHNGTSWVKSKADAAANAVVGGIVSYVISADVFILATAGYVSGLSGLTAGSVHYLSSATAGALTTTAPTSLVIPVISPDSATSGVLVFGNSLPALNLVLGIGALTGTSTQGLLGVVKSNDGDYIKLSSGGIEIFDRSVSASTALIKIDVGHASLTSTARQLNVREVYVCDSSTGTVKTMMLVGSAAY